MWGTLSENGLRNVVYIFGFQKYDHEQVWLLLKDVEQLFLGPKVDISLVVDVCFVAEIIVLHIVIRVKDVVVEHISKHILFSQEDLVPYIRKLSFNIYPTFSIVSYSDVLMPYEFSSKGAQLQVTRVVEHNWWRLLFL